RHLRVDYHGDPGARQTGGCSAYSEPPERENPSACWTNLWNAASTAALSLRATPASQPRLTSRSIRARAAQRGSKSSPPAAAPVSAASARRPRSVHRARHCIGLEASGWLDYSHGYSTTPECPFASVGNVHVAPEARPDDVQTQGAGRRSPAPPRPGRQRRRLRGNPRGSPPLSAGGMENKNAGPSHRLGGGGKRGPW